MNTTKDIICPNCKYAIKRSECVKLIGTATVEGHTSIDKFLNEGVAWSAHESWDEEIECPKCKEKFDPFGVE